MILGSFTALFELLFFAMVKNQPLSVSRTSLYLYLTLLGFVVIFCVRNKDHFWEAPKLSRPLQWSFGVIAILTTVIVYIRPTQKLFSFTPLSFNSIGLIVSMTVLYLIFLDVIKVGFSRSKNTVPHM
jgi:magnesium-transporting ATPase (P-type)